MDRVDAEANKILKQELGQEWDERTYKDIRLDPYLCGFTSKYLYDSASYRDFLSFAKLSTLLKLAALDLEKGTSISELVFSCCWWFPKREAIERLRVAPTPTFFGVILKNGCVLVRNGHQKSFRVITSSWGQLRSN